MPGPPRSLLGRGSGAVATKGDGAVVADEVKQLADGTPEHTERIAENVEEGRSQAGNAPAGSARIGAVTREQSQVVDELSDRVDGLTSENE